MSDTDHSIQEFVAALRNQIPSEAITVHPDRTQVSQLSWNRAVSLTPVAVVECATAEHISSCLVAARQAGLPLSVRGGGHDPWGRGLRQGGIVIDLRKMREVNVEGKIAVVDGGATVSDLLDSAAPTGMAAAVGTVGSVGVTGLMFYGGYGSLIGKAGFAIDNVVSADVVLADGTITHTSREEDPDLFWAINGGGGGFGIVARMTVQLHHVPRVTTGQFGFAWPEARNVLTGLRHLTAEADEDLDVMFAVAGTPNGPALLTSAVWSGPEADGSDQVNRVRGLGTPIPDFDTVSTLPLAHLVHAGDAMFGPGMYRMGSRLLPADLDSALDAFIAAGQNIPVGCFLNVHHAHGQACVPNPDATAYPYRSEHLLVQVIGRWADDAEGDVVTAVTDWVAEAERILDLHALPGGWVAMMASSDDRAETAFGDNTRRLLEIKARYDPNRVFEGTPLPRSPFSL